MLGKDLAEERTFQNPQSFYSVLLVSIKPNFHANSFWMLEEEVASDILDRMTFLGNHVPGPEGSDKLPPLHVASVGCPTMQKIPQTVTKQLLLGLSDLLSQRTHRVTFVPALVCASAGEPQPCPLWDVLY
jgi:hypothetical protein